MIVLNSILITALLCGVIGLMISGESIKEEEEKEKMNQ